MHGDLEPAQKREVVGGETIPPAQDTECLLREGRGEVSVRGPQEVRPGYHDRQAMWIPEESDNKADTRLSQGSK